MTLLLESNDAQVVKVHPQSYVMPLVGSFGPFNCVVLDRGDYTLNELHDSLLGVNVIGDLLWQSILNLFKCVMGV